MAALIKINGLKKRYRDGKENELEVLKQVDLEINCGEKIAIIGDSGCGKSTLLNILGLILTPSEGEIVLMGQAIKALSQKEKAQMRNHFFGYVVQDFALVESDTVYRNVEIPLLYTKEKMRSRDKNKIIYDALEKVKIPDKINENVKNLSGGQRQRVAIARAIVNHPKVILADEPTGALDENTSETVLKLLYDLVDNASALVMVTHNKQIAETCDRIYQIENGNLKKVK